MNNQEIPQPIKDMLDKAAVTYSQSPATTNAGRILRFIAKFVSVDIITKLFVHKTVNK
jgi:hypothetical protein